MNRRRKKQLMSALRMQADGQVFGSRKVKRYANGDPVFGDEPFQSAFSGSADDLRREKQSRRFSQATPGARNRRRGASAARRDTGAVDPVPAVATGTPTPSLRTPSEAAAGLLAPLGSNATDAEIDARQNELDAIADADRAVELERERTNSLLELGVGAPTIDAGDLGRRNRGSLVVDFASGGGVNGPGGPRTDDIPAMLSDGEYVLPADVVDTVGMGTLDTLRNQLHTFPEESAGAMQAKSAQRRAVKEQPGTLRLAEGGGFYKTGPYKHMTREEVELVDRHIAPPITGRRKQPKKAPAKISGEAQQQRVEQAEKKALGLRDGGSPGKRMAEERFAEGGGFFLTGPYREWTREDVETVDKVAPPIVPGRRKQPKKAPAKISGEAQQQRVEQAEKKALGMQDGGDPEDWTTAAIGQRLREQGLRPGLTDPVPVRAGRAARDAVEFVGEGAATAGRGLQSVGRATAPVFAAPWAAAGAAYSGLRDAGSQFVEGFAGDRPAAVPSLDDRYDAAMAAAAEDYAASVDRATTASPRFRGARPQQPGQTPMLPAEPAAPVEPAGPMEISMLRSPLRTDVETALWRDPVNRPASQLDEAAFEGSMADPRVLRQAGLFDRQGPLDPTYGGRFDGVIDEQDRASRQALRNERLYNRALLEEMSSDPRIAGRAQRFLDRRRSQQEADILARQGEADMLRAEADVDRNAVDRERIAAETELGYADAQQRGQEALLRFTEAQARAAQDAAEIERERVAAEREITREDVRTTIGDLYREYQGVIDNGWFDEDQPQRGYSKLQNRANQYVNDVGMTTEEATDLSLIEAALATMAGDKQLPRLAEVEYDAERQKLVLPGGGRRRELDIEDILDTLGGYPVMAEFLDQEDRKYRLRLAELAEQERLAAERETDG